MNGNCEMHHFLSFHWQLHVNLMVQDLLRLKGSLSHSASLHLHSVKQPLPSPVSLHSPRSPFTLAV